MIPNIHAMTCELPPGDETGECAVCASMLEEIRIHVQRLLRVVRSAVDGTQQTLGEWSDE